MSTYIEQYRDKLTTAEEAAGRIRSGDVIIHGVTIAEPPALLHALADRLRHGGLGDVTVYSFNPQKHASESYLSPDLMDRVLARSWFLSPAARKMAAVGIVQFIPSYLHQVPKLIREELEVDVAMTTVSPMDKAGYFSFGTANDLTSTAAREAEILMVEVNENMPRVFGESLLHISEVDMVVENHVPLMEIGNAAPRPEDEIVGRLIADIVPDGAVLQLGIGNLPNAICPQLKDHKDLGIHSELFGPGMADLVRRGVINGRRKTLFPRKHIFSVAYGNRDTFEFMHDNPAICSYPADYVMNPSVVARNDRMVAVNSIIQVDLTGQCNAEHMAGNQYSGTGGQLDFVRGAYMSKGGKSVMAFYSTARGGKVSRVVPRLGPDAAVTTPRMDVHYLCTEYGLVNIKHLSVGERAEAVISLAHPDFREELTREAERMRLL